MDLGLEVIGQISAVEKEETPPTAALSSPVKRLRDSHHALARALAFGLSPTEAAYQTGYAVGRVYSMSADPMFQELVEFYRVDRDSVAHSVEEKFRLVAEDARQIVHERMLDEGADIPLLQALEVFKVMADRAGYAPVQRSVTKNLNLNIGERLDAARRRRDESGV